MDLKIKDVAELLNLSETTIRRWVVEGKIPSYRLNQHHFFSRNEIENWVLSHRSNHTSKREQEVHSRANSRGSQQFSLFRAIHKGGILRHLNSCTKESLLREASTKIAKHLHMDADVMAELLLDREKLMPTALNNGIAVPHTRDSLLQQHQDLIFILFLDDPLPYGALDGEPVHTLFFLFASEDKRHLHLLAKIAHLSQHLEALSLLKAQPSKEHLLAFIKEWESTIPQIIC